MSLKDKEITLLYENSYVEMDEVAFMYSDVKEAVLEFDEFRVVQVPYKAECDGCKKRFELIFTRNKFKSDDYHYCKSCLIKKILGDFNK